MSLLRGLMRYRALVLAIAMSGGCSVGEVEGLTSDASPNDPAALSFNSMIKPIVTPRCTATCHSPGKTQPTPALDEYANLQPNYKVAPATNVLLTHLPDGAPHQTTTFFSTSEKAIVSAWLNTL
jgi:hypothetical protein